MPVLSDTPPADAAPAYAAGNGQNNRRNVWLIVGAIVGLLLIRNVVTKDYSGKQKNYLREIGRDDLVAKTARERSDEALAQQELISTLATRVEELELGQATLRAELKALRAGNRGSTATTAGNAGETVDLFGGDDVGGGRRA